MSVYSVLAVAGGFSSERRATRFMIKYAAIPTIYKGVQFRSRLEARWACMFDLAYWEWEYEPFDAEGYIPDFLIRRRTPGDYIVEVKPIDNLNTEDGFAKLNECVAKARAGGIDMPVVVLGSRIHKASSIIDIGDDNSELSYSAIIGSISERESQDTLRFYMWEDFEQTHDMWVHAGNLTQWKGR